MNPTYEPEAVEADWYERWEAAGVFRPEYRPDGEPFAVVIPPPNVTGVLHMGHGLNHTIHDVVIRRKRMQGYAALWLPGTDHAGIATQNVVERELANEGLTRHDLGREAFVEQVWEWRRKYGARITSQIRRMGSSCDWTRERFTMDEGLSVAVREVFVTLYEEGLVYRGNRIINWCPRCETALSDIEVEHVEELGTLTHIRYPLTDGSGEIVVATTRPETMLGDTGVAVHPDDERYRHMIGRTVTLPLVGREIPIVADDWADPEFGSGAVKVTPAHDANDFEVGQRHGLEPVVVLDTRGVVNENGGRFAGLDRFEARTAIQQALEKEGFLVKVEDHRHSVGRCYRCDSVVEPYLSDQWFVAVTDLARPAIDAVKDDENVFIPKRWENTYFHWMENLRDWTISRQIWWGHRIPAWYCPDGHITVSRIDPTSCATCASPTIAQDPDVLDTWFSSALFPFSTLGWPEQTADLARYYPNAVLITGFDIIFFWVARMMKMGIHFMGEVPFRQTIIHGLVRDANGEKMSKSKGNTIDPIDVANEYGADPLRLALIQAANPGQDVPLDMEWVAGARRFGNKLWNATRFALRHVEPGSVPADGGYPEDPGPVDAWILQRLGEVAADFDTLCDEYRFSDAFGRLYSFAWSEVFDWYLEMAKTMLDQSSSANATRQTLGVVIRDLLKLFHPAMPYLTEELWQHVVGDGLIAGADWPVVPRVDGPDGMGDIQDLIAGIRRFRAEQGISPRQPLTLKVAPAVDGWAADVITKLGAADLSAIDTAPESGHTRIVAGSLQGFIALDGVIDLEAERSRIDKAIMSAEQDLLKVERKLANAAFMDKAPDDIVAKERSKQAEFEGLLAKLREQRNTL
ncbi:MAG TPA: valine--tRNA ligase [Acidimicrobiia bacterium]|nr:valine--tRNA ligase [Acidimicrobiia bacterium]